MDRIPPAPSGGTAEDDRPSPELLAAVEQASRHLGVGSRPGAARPALRFDAAGSGRLRVWVLGALLVLSAAVAALAPLARPREQPAADVEADLRWAVAAVVREVEAQRARTGMLPGADALRPLLGEHVQYIATGGSYVVSAERDGIGVRFDGTVPLDVWLAARGGRQGPPRR